MDIKLSEGCDKMSEAILNEIIKTEQEAARIEEESRKLARDKVADAKKRAADILENSITESEAIAADILQKAEAQAKLEIIKKQEEALKSTAEISNSAEQRLDKAVQFIMGRIVEFSGNH